MARRLQLAGYRIKAATTDPEKAEHLRQSGLETYIVKLSGAADAELPPAFFAADILILTVPPGGRRDPEVERTYPAKIRQAITAAKAGGVEHLLFTSSTGIYGEQQGIVTEDSPLTPVTASGKALVKVEALLRDNYGPQLTVLRLAGLVGGERQPGRWFAGKQDVPGGEQVVNLVHRQDVMAIIEQIIDESHWGQTLNICADEHPTKAEFYPAAARALGLKAPTFMVTESKDRGKLVENERSKVLLGYRYEFSDPIAFPGSK